MMASIAAPRPGRGADRLVLRAAGTALVAASWASGLLFGLYILRYYLGAPGAGAMARWNANLPAIYSSDAPAATIAIGAHFAAGAVLLMLGPVQLIRPIRDRFRALHRWLGRAYAIAAGLAGLGGLWFIAAKGTVGGAVMDVGFGLYGALVALAAAQTWRHGWARRIERHRAWGIRLVALVVGSWLYRMDYGFWLSLTHDFGHNESFTGGFDRAMAFLFYLPNLAVAELFIRERRQGTPAGRWLAAAVLAAATGVVLLGTWFFATRMWLPGIIGDR